MSRPLGSLRAAIAAARRASGALAGRPARSVLLGTVLLLSGLSVAMGFVLSQYYGVDVVSSLTFFPDDCWADWGINIGRHCFSDYGMVAGAGLRSNPYEPYALLPPNPPVLMQYPAAGMVPHVLFAVAAKWLGAPRLGLIAYVMALAVAVLFPAVWAARGSRGLERIVVFLALSIAAIPAWAVIDRGNSTAFMVPVALWFLIALRRGQWNVVTVMVILAALVKPQFAVLAVALFAARRWRLGGIAIAGIAASNIAAYLVWPKAFPGSIAQSIHNIGVNNTDYGWLLPDMRNISFGRAMLLIPDIIKMGQTGGRIPADFLNGPRMLLGYAVAIVVICLVFLLGRRVSSMMTGIVLLTVGCLCPPVALFYYLVFALPIAAVLVRDPGDPDRRGWGESTTDHAPRRRAVNLCISLAAALSIAQIPLPGPISRVDIPGMGTHSVVGTTLIVTPFLWLIACAAILLSYARKPDSQAKIDPANADESAAATKDDAPRSAAVSADLR